MTRPEIKAEVLYLSSSGGLNDIFKDIAERLELLGFVGKNLVLSIDIQSGLPHNDYGQTVRVEYIEKPEAYNFPNRELAKQVQVMS